MVSKKAGALVVRPQPVDRTYEALHAVRSPEMLQQIRGAYERRFTLIKRSGFDKRAWT